jgi:hypothetical protein
MKPGFFRNALATVVAGEILHHAYALRGGEEYPIQLYIDEDCRIVPFPGLHDLAVQLQL